MKSAGKRFEKLRREHEKAVEARKEAASKRSAIKGVGGPLGDLTALASDLGTAAVETELALLRTERKALKKLHDFACKAVAKGEKS